MSKEKIRLALVGKQEQPEVVRRKSSVWETVRPLKLRGGLNREIEDVTHFTYRQIKKAVDRERPSWYALPVPRAEEQMYMKKKAYKLRGARRRGNNLPDENAKIAKALVEAGWFTEDLSYWRALNVLYESSGRVLPESFALTLCCEAYLRCRIKQGGHIDRERLDEYIRLLGSVRKSGEPLCPDSLVAEQKFILSKTDGNRLQHKV